MAVRFKLAAMRTSSAIVTTDAKDTTRLMQGLFGSLLKHLSIVWQPLETHPKFNIPCGLLA